MYIYMLFPILQHLFSNCWIKSNIEKKNYTNEEFAVLNMISANWLFKAAACIYVHVFWLSLFCILLANFLNGRTVWLLIEDCLIFTSCTPFKNILFKQVRFKRKNHKMPLLCKGNHTCDIFPGQYPVTILSESVITVWIRACYP